MGTGVEKRENEYVGAVLPIGAGCWRTFGVAREPRERNPRRPRLLPRLEVGRGLDLHPQAAGGHKVELIPGGTDPVDAPEGKTVLEARRCHKRQLANLLIRHLWKDVTNLAAEPLRRPPA